MVLPMPARAAARLRPWLLLKILGPTVRLHCFLQARQHVAAEDLDRLHRIWTERWTKAEVRRTERQQVLQARNQLLGGTGDADAEHRWRDQRQSSLRVAVLHHRLLDRLELRFVDSETR